MKFALEFQNFPMTVIDLPAAPLVGQTIDVAGGAKARVDAVFEAENGVAVIKATRLIGVSHYGVIEGTGLT